MVNTKKKNPDYIISVEEINTFTNVLAFGCTNLIHTTEEINGVVEHTIVFTVLK